mgnify:CR=1 FL=1
MNTGSDEVQGFIDGDPSRVKKDTTAEVELVVRLCCGECKVDVREHLWRTIALQHDALQLGIGRSTGEGHSCEKSKGV